MTPQQIKKLRPEGMTQSEWAGMLGVDPSTVYRWEAGETKPPVSAIMIMKIFSKKMKK
jgi:DNA-binding transcriptional regulator YiaG